MVSYTNWPAYRALKQAIALKPISNGVFGRRGFWERSKVLIEFNFIDLILLLYLIIIYFIKIIKHGLKSPNPNDFYSFQSN